MTLSSFEIVIEFELLFVYCFLFELLIALFIDCLLSVLDLFWISVKLCSSRVEEKPVSVEIQKSLSLLTEWVSIAF